MIEYVCVVFVGFYIDNCEICVDCVEMLGSDGLSWEYVGVLLEVGIVK